MTAKKKKRTATTTGRKRGRPRRNPEAAAPAAKRAPFKISGHLSTPVEVLPADDITLMIDEATTTPHAEAGAVLEALADDISHEMQRDARAPLTGPIHTPGSSVTDKAMEQFSQQIAGLSVVVFGLTALWRGPEWTLEEDEAQLIGDACAEPYAGDLEELTKTVKWLGPAAALLGVVGRKALAEAKRRKDAGKEVPPRAPGLAPADAGKP